MPRRAGYTLEELIELQREKKLGNVHLLAIDSTGFNLAHTDEERALIDLEDCQIHLYLSEFSEAPEFLPEGIYTWDLTSAEGIRRLEI